MIESLEKAIDTYNRLAPDNDRIRKSVEGKLRIVEIRLRDGNGYNFIMEGVTAHSLKEGRCNEKADIIVDSTSEILEGIMKGEVSPFKAMARREIVIHAPIMDLLLMKKLFSA
ncbi:MAG: hypothetical protein QGH39_04475 [Candidatus Thermoplasmatota archaeon]|jgi:putative sterol carrier protein|nr:hypothetical protein [Candidatus Thermoplasmatota archaeon]MDP7264799.1 hypothetical protein [Candidatus Thermoplasmatota archaeon]